MVFFLTCFPMLWAQTSQRKIGELELAVGGLTAGVSPAEPVIPKNISSGIRINVTAGGNEMSAEEVSQFLGGEFAVQGTLSGPGLSQTVDVPQTGAEAPVTSDPLLLLLPSLPKAGDYTLSNLRFVVNGNSVLDVTPGTVTVKVIDQVLVTSVQTRALTLEEIQEKGIVLDSGDYLGFQFEIGLLLSSKVVNLSFPVVFNRQGVAVPQALKLPEVERLKIDNPDLPDIQPVLLKAAGDVDLPTISLPGGGTGEINIPAVLVIPGNVGYLKQFFSAQLYVANGTPEGSNLVVHDVTAKINLPAGSDGVLGTADDPLALPNTSQGPQPDTMAVLGPGPDGSLTSATLDPGQTGEAEFLIRGEKEGYHAIDFDIGATLEGLVTGPVAVTAKANGGVLVRNPYFDMTFITPGIVRKDDDFNLYVSVSNISQALANDVQVTLNNAMLSGAVLLNEDTQAIATLQPGASQMLKFHFRSLRTGKVVATYLHLDTENGTTGSLQFSLGVDSRNVPLSPDTLSLPASLSSLPVDVIDAAMRVLGEAWGVANAPAGTLTPGVIRISRAVVTGKALALAEAGLRQSLGQSVSDVLKDIAFDFWGGSPVDPGFDQLLRTSDAGYALAQALGASLADLMIQSGGALNYQQQLSQVAVSGPDFILFTAANGASAAPVSIALTDGAGKSVSSSLPGGTLPGGVIFPLGAPDNAPLLGLLTSFTSPSYTLEITELASGTADLAITVPRGDGNVVRATATGIQIEPGQRLRAVVNLTNYEGLILQADTAGDGIFATTVPLVQEVISPPGPTFISATIIGPETISQASTYGLHMAMLFDRIVDKNTALAASNYSIPSNRIQYASRQLSGRLVFASLNQPEGPYVPSTVSVAGMADLRGMVGQAATVPLQSKLQTPGAVVSGRVMNADGSPATNAVVTYVNDPPLPPDDICPQICDPIGISAVPVNADGYYQFRYVHQSDCGVPYMIATNDPNTGARHYIQGFANYAGENLVYDFVLFGLGTVTGTVRDLNGQPVYGAEVYAISRTDSQVSGKAISDGNGLFTINGITVGPVIVRAVKGINLGLAAGNIDRAGATSVIDVTLDGGTVQVTGTVQKIENGVTSTVPGVPVIYYVNGTAVGATKTGDDGTYVLAGMPVGPYRIMTGLNTRDTAEVEGVAAANDHLQKNLTIVPGVFGVVKGVVKLPNGEPAADTIVSVNEFGVLTNPDGSFYLQGAPVKPSVTQTVQARSMDGKRFGQANFMINTPGQEVPVSITLSGLGSAQFTVLNASGQPIAGQEVKLPAANNPCGQISQTTDSNGNVTFAGLKLGTVKAKAVLHGPGFIDVAEGLANILQDNVTAFGILRFNGTGTVSGNVLNPDATASHGALVELISRSYDQETCALSEGVSQQVLTGVNGTFLFNGVNVGKIGVRASQAFFPIKVGANAVLQENGDAANLTLQLVDSISGELSGTVFLPDGVTPAGPGVEVTANGPLPDITVLTDSLGAFRFARIFPSGRYTLTASDPATGSIVQETITLSANQNFTQDLRLLGTGAVRVHVVDGAGNPVNAAFIRLNETDFPKESFDGFLYEYDQGVLVFEDVFEGPVNIVVTDGFGRGGRASAVLPHGIESIDVQVQLTTTGTVEGHFRRPDGTPIPYGAVSLYAAGRIIGHVATQGTGDVGFFSFEYVPAGPITLSAQDPVTARTGYAASSLETEGQVVTVNIVAGSIGNVQGVVTGNGMPQPGATVKVVSGSFKASTTADSNGHYYVGGVPEGSITATASFGGGFLSGTASAMLLGDGTTLTLDVAMRTSGSVTGRVLKSDGASAAPLSTVTIEVGGVGGGKATTTTDAQGNFSFDRVPAGNGTINVEVLGSIDRGKSTVVVPENSSVNADITLNGVGALTGLALDSGGQPVGGTVYLTGTGSFPYSFTLTAGADGSFQLPEVLAGTFNAKLKASIGGFVLYGYASGAIVSGQAANVQIQLQPSGAVTGLVVRDDGVTPAVGAEIKLMRETGTSITLQAQTDGSFTATGVPLGAYTIRVHDELFGGLGWMEGVSLVSNEETVDVGTIVLNESDFAVVTTDPAEGDQNVAVNKVITVVFNSPLKSISGISVTKGSTTLSITRELSDDFRTVTLTGAWPHTSDLTLNLSSTITDKFDRRLGQPVSIHFRTMDQTAPSVAAVSPADDAIQVVTGTAIVITFNEDLLAGLNVDGIVTLAGPDGPVAGQSMLSAPNAITFTPSAALADNAAYTVTVNGATDSYGNVQTAAFTSSFMTPDTVAPGLEMVYPPADGATNNTLPNICIAAADALTGIDPATIVVTIDGQVATASFAGSEICFTPSVALVEGPHTLNAQVSDRAGNLQTLSTGFAVDTVPPSQAVISGPVPDQVIQGVYTFSATATDDLGMAKIEIYADGNLIVSLPAPDFSATYDTFNLNEGAHNLTARAVDTAGNTGPMSESIRVYVSKTVMTINITSPANNGLFSTQVTVKATTSKAAQEVSFTIGDQTVTDTAAPFEAVLDLTGVADGQPTITVNAVGTIPGETATATRSIRVDNTPPAPPDMDLINAEPPINGVSLVHGSAGSVESNATVQIAHIPTGAVISTTAAANGSFAANVTADIDDPLGMTAIDAAGNAGFPSYTSVRSIPSIPPSSGTTSLHYEGLAVDQVGLAAGSYSPDGQMDGVFSLSIDIGEGVTRTLSYIELDNGSIKRSTRTGNPPLGIAPDAGSPLINGTDGTVSSPMTSGGTLSLIAGNDGFIAEGLTYTVVVMFTDGARFVARYTITPAADRALVAHSATVTAIDAETGINMATVEVSESEPGIALLTIDNIRDIDGTLVPDGAKIAVSAVNMASMDPTGTAISSAGGTILDGEVASNNANFKVFTIAGGKAEVTFSSYPVTPEPVMGTRAIVQIQAADASGNVLGTKAIATFDINIRAAADRAIIALSPTQLYADGADRRSHFTIAVRDELGNSVPDDTPVLVAAHSCATYNPTGSCISTDGGQIIGGYDAWVDGGWRLFFAAGGKIEGDYSSSGIEAGTREIKTAVIQVLFSTTDDGRYSSRYAIGTARLPLVGAASAVIEVVPNSVPYVFPEASYPQIFVDHIKDMRSGLVPDGSKILISASSCAGYYNSSGGCISSAGGTIVDGESSPSGSNYRAFTINGGRAIATYSIAGVTDEPATSETKTANIQVLMSDTQHYRINRTAIQYAPLRVLGPANALGFAQPATIFGDGALHTATVTFGPVLDWYGNPLPDGTKVVASAASCGGYNSSGGCISSAGGQVLNGDLSPSGGNYKVLTIQDGKVVIDYGDQGVISDPGEKRTANVVLLPADDDGSYLSRYSMGVVPVKIAGLTSAVGTANPGSVFADGSDQRTTVTLTDFKDAAGQPVPDGTVVAVSAKYCFAYTTSGSCVHSAGGQIIGDLTASWDSTAKLFTITNGQVVLEYSSQGVSVDRGSETARIQVTAVTPQLTSISRTGLVSVPVTLLSPGSAVIEITPGDLSADGGDHRSQVVISRLLESDGATPVPDGTKIGLVASDNCDAYTSSGGCLYSEGGTILSAGTSPGDGTPSSNYPEFKIFTVAGGQVQAVYSNQDIAAGFNRTETAKLAVVAADTNGAILTRYSIAIGTLQLHGTTSATASGPTTLSRSSGSTGTITFSGIKDSAGNIVPDGAMVVATADDWASNNNNGTSNRSTGGLIIDGSESPSGSQWKVFTVQNGSVTITYSPEGAANGIARIQLVPAKQDGTKLGSYALIGGVWPITITD